MENQKNLQNFEGRLKTGLKRASWAFMVVAIVGSIFIANASENYDESSVAATTLIWGFSWIFLGLGTAFVVGALKDPDE